MRRGTAFTVIILVVVHALMAVEAWAEAGPTGRMAATGDVLDLPGLSTALISMVILVLVGVASLRGLRRRISYERWHFLHLLTYLAVALGFVRAWQRARSRRTYREIR